MVLTRKGTLCQLFIYILFIMFFVFSLKAAASAPSVDAESAVLLHADSGAVLYEKNADKRLPQASTTKITTIILALEKGDLSDEVDVSKYAAETRGSAIWLEEGEKLTLEELIYAALLSSANDASVAVAEHISGSEETFVNEMNKKAREIGAFDTHYVNPHGLHDEDQYSTAYDLSIIGRYAMQNPKFREIVSTEKKVIDWPGHEWSRLLINKNNLITKPDLLPGADGIKNGYTTPAGNCLVASAQREGMRLIAVVLDASNATNQAAELLEYGFQNFEEVSVVSKGEVVGEITVGENKKVDLTAADDFDIAVKDEEKREITRVIDTPKEKSTVEKGEVVGQVIYKLNGKEVGKIDLEADQNANSGSLYSNIWRTFFDIFAIFS